MECTAFIIKQTLDEAHLKQNIFMITLCESYSLHN